MPGINSILNIGQGALFAEQAAIHVTGNNIANVNTPGYSRQAVRFEDRGYIDYIPGQIGLGTRAAEVIRYFDEFIEKAYVDKNGAASRWEVSPLMRRLYVRAIRCPVRTGRTSCRA